MASIPISHPKLVFFLSRSLHLHGCDMLLASVKLGAMKSFPSKHTIRITPQTPVAADNSYNAAIFPDIFEKVIQLFLSWAFSSCCVPARLSPALMNTTSFGFFSFPLTAARGMLNAKESPLRIPSLGPSDDGPEMCYVFHLINLLTEMSSYSKSL